MSRFPSGRYGRQLLEFFPAPFRAPLRAFAALVFPWCGDEVLLCNIEDRGWCIPSGRVEPNETSLEAAAREAREEAGAVLQDILYLGCYRISERGEVRWADVYAARVKELVDIPAEFESMGRMYVTVDQLPEIYHLWNPLTEAIFDYSAEVLRRHAATLGMLEKS
ncbi:MAG: NUDIX domain-containing protein [Fimbriimonadaceae bacterium]|nr:NUDIX domain-containing protein [Fimbriimonadaceae bacterium]QYK54830.1 MAG: NUDIX domain-containing protein [Fimbriimonadaceae bacterium]